MSIYDGLNIIYKYDTFYHIKILSIYIGIWDFILKDKFTHFT